LSRGLQILEALAGSKRGITLSELARKLRIPKSTTQRLLCTLKASGYVYCEYDNRHFFVGEKMSQLSRRAVQSRCLCGRTYILLDDLRRKCQLAVHLAVLEDDEVVIRSKLESIAVKDDTNWVGKHVEMHASALGKAILAFLPDSQAERFIRTHGLPRYNDNTIFSHNQLREHLKLIRYRGFAFDNEEAELGFRRVASPIFLGGGSVAAAVDVTGTTEQISSENLPSLADLVKREAAEISRTISPA